MQVLVKADETILSILKKFIKKTPSCRPFRFCVQTPVEEGLLLFNLLTNEALLLSNEEYNNRYQLDYLKEHWFLVPEEANDKEYADFVKWVLANKQKKNNAITSYTIFPTTDCNARCFYCFELGRSRIPMTNETALKVVEYIKAHCDGKTVNISWFGGEPLFNASAIDTICDGLRSESIDFRSSMVSNGYLFNEETVKNAVEKWKLKRVQITLDGTEKVYNKTKAYIYKEENPYHVVLKNIEHLLDASVSINVRMNMDLYNAKDLLQLVDELANRFGGRKGIAVYAHHIFKEGVALTEQYADEEWKARDAAMIRLEERIQQSGLAAKQGLHRVLKLNHCMADSGHAVTILPDGNVGLCEHYSESEFAGHIDRKGFDTAVVESWKEMLPEIPECAECFYYPACLRLKKCPNSGGCYPLYRQEQSRKVKRAMISHYENLKNKIEVEEEENAGNC